jgi:hypothetical protein
MTEEKALCYRPSYELYEVKHLALEEIKIAQDVNNRECLSYITTYQIYHNKISKYFKRKLSKQDYFAYIILLTYPENMIRQFNKFEELNLFTDKDNSDFIYIETRFVEHDDITNELLENLDCVCSQLKLKTIHIYRNKYTGILIQIGSECVKKHKLISQKELIELKKKIKELKILNEDMLLEKNEGKPIGYYKEKREKEKQEKENNKNKKLEKIKENINKKLESKNYKRCIYCCNNIFCIKKIKINIEKFICSKSCLNNNLNLLNEIYKKSYEYDECASCNIEFIHKKNKYICMNCEKKEKIIKCQLCENLFIDNIISNDKYCTDCEKNIILCNSCNMVCLKSYLVDDKCQQCNHILKNNLIKKICLSCKKPLYLNNSENYRTFCKDCYKTNLIKVNCIECSNEFTRLSSQNWKKYCNICYKNI